MAKKVQVAGLSLADATETLVGKTVEIIFRPVGGAWLNSMVNVGRVDQSYIAGVAFVLVSKDGKPPAGINVPSGAELFVLGD